MKLVCKMRNIMPVDLSIQYNLGSNNKQVTLQFKSESLMLLQNPL